MQSHAAAAAILSLLLPVGTAIAAQHQLSADNLALRLDDDGQIVGSVLGARGLSRALTGGTLLEGCRQEGDVTTRRLEGGAVEFHSRVTCGQKGRAVIVQRFAPAPDSVRWQVEISSPDEPWTTPVTTILRWPSAARVRLWTPWMLGDERWQDPLEPQPLAEGSWEYGPYFGDGISIPLVTVLESEPDAGLSLVLSPEDTILDTTLSARAEGSLSFRRFNHRLGQGRTTRFSMDFVAHEADWRGGLRWMVKRYRPFFDPPNPGAAEMAGTGAYSGWTGAIDEHRLERSAFRLLWEASFDYPYYGMLYPPAGEETWRKAGHDSGGKRIPELATETSYRAMNDRARRLRDAGFYHLSYFGFSEWDLADSAKVDYDLPAKDWWKDAMTFLRRRIADGIWRDKDGKESYGGWARSIVMDPAGPDYQAWILEEARRVVERIPASSGLAIDRMWWATKLEKGWQTPVNFGADDGVGWYERCRGRHFSMSWKGVLAKLGPVMHGAGKVIFVNPCMGYRLDIMRDVDGFFDEVWPTPRGLSRLNGTGLLALRKPAILWTGQKSWLEPDPDAFFQRHLYMGVYPMVPFPKNDHSINPDPRAERFYLDYGQLMDAMRGKRWVLEPHAIRVEAGEAKANLFEVPGGWVAPVMFGPQDGTVRVAVRGLAGLSGKFRCEALHPGVEQPRPLPSRFEGGALRIEVPLKRGCAMVRLAKPE